MKILKTALAILPLILLPGCIAVPVGPAYYDSAPGYYYAPAPAYYGPSVGIGIYGGRRGYGYYGHGR